MDDLNSTVCAASSAGCSDRWQRLVAWIRAEAGSCCGRALVAFSGGVDSTLLVKAAETALGAANVVAAHGSSVLESDERRQLVGEIFAANFPELPPLVELDLQPLEVEGIAANGALRCYHCKKNLYRRLRRTAEQFGISVLFDGTNHDDLSAVRPGLKALVEEGVVTPLAALQFSKSDVRKLAREHGLTNSGLAAESCLATRLPQGRRLTRERLAATAAAETAVRRLGLPVARVKADAGTIVVEFWTEDAGTRKGQSCDFSLLRTTLQPFFLIFAACEIRVRWRRFDSLC